MKNLYLRFAAPGFLCASVLVSAASAADTGPAAALALGGIDREIQVHQLKALTDEQLREILDRVERERADAFAAANRRAARREVPLGRTSKLTFSPSSPPVRYSGMSMDVDADEEEVIVEWYVGF